MKDSSKYIRNAAIRGTEAAILSWKRKKAEELKRVAVVYDERIKKAEERLNFLLKGEATNEQQ